MGLLMVIGPAAIYNVSSSNVMDRLKKKRVCKVSTLSIFTEARSSLISFEY